MYQNYPLALKVTFFYPNTSHWHRHQHQDTFSGKNNSYVIKSELIKENGCMISSGQRLEEKKRCHSFRNSPKTGKWEGEGSNLKPNIEFQTQRLSSRIWLDLWRV